VDVAATGAAWGLSPALTSSSSSRINPAPEKTHGGVAPSDHPAAGIVELTRPVPQVAVHVGGKCHLGDGQGRGECDTAFDDGLHDPGGPAVTGTVWLEVVQAVDPRSGYVAQVLEGPPVSSG